MAKPCDRLLRFTPACAGTCLSSSIALCLSSVHPRVRGDMNVFVKTTKAADGSPPRARGHAVVIGFRFRPHGSPPRARGHDALLLLFHCVSRFTPACAGTCGKRAASMTTSSVHPRVRGDMPSASVPMVAPSGSPPRARGHGSTDHHDDLWSRFTPACAGTCSATSTPTAGRTVHPRVRGDMRSVVPQVADRSGSPPRARGHGKRHERRERR